ncbi:Protein of unknown function [Dyadobacter sp. SG02]|uniref:DUF2442 domain-containing protein n=1 Tax=Dyadobacter sp. SG02 TaxID=1855291 RepID=UPI0008AEF4DB|nr:DUF2442 domain-containing protein [Dyadobacter sp. SG02]SEI73076.1 Protein of unknown function [Dyadobacter sp. SG02]
MKKSFKPGITPSISKQLQTLLSEAGDDDVIDIADDMDRMILDSGLQIRHFGFARDLDLALFILNDKRVITRPLSSFPFLEKAEDWDLDQYTISQSGIHWTILDADISLRGLLQEEEVLTK